MLDDRFEQSTKLLAYARTQHDDVLAQFSTLKTAVGKAHVFLREYRRRWSQTNDDNRHLRTETKRMRHKIDDFHRAEGILHKKIDEQDATLTQLRQELR
jgi:chromosome segregation ATPase